MSADDNRDIFLVQFVNVDNTGSSIRGKSHAGPVLNNSSVDAVDLRAIRDGHELQDVPAAAAAAEVRRGDPGAIAMPSASASTSRNTRTRHARNPLMSVFDGTSGADPPMTPMTPTNTNTDAGTAAAAAAASPPMPPLMQLFQDAAEAFHREHHAARRDAAGPEGLTVTSVRVVWRDVGLGATDLFKSTPGAFERQLELVRRRGRVDHLRVCYATHKRQSFANKVMNTFTLGRTSELGKHL
ncbi:hypothetical protein DL769_004722 [Monosporascus sp. CRB-8-3]|nr:hypothetical protein DL769_004722 [Monosporascus sp. CRB-8-3]